MKTVRYLMASFMVIIASQTIWAQEEDALSKLVNDNKEEIYALSLYPEEIREAILETSQHPEILVKLKAVQAKTSQSFESLLNYLPEADQKKYWELAKYKGLINKVVAGGQKNTGEIKDILKNYPEEIHATALEYGVQRYSTLVKINAISQEADKATALLLETYPGKTRESVRLLLDYPEVIYLLNENLELVLIVGDAYAKNPVMVRRKADSIQTEASLRYTQEINEWEKGLAEDPQVLKEFEEVSSAFTEDNGYKEYDPMYPDAVSPVEKEVEEKQDEVRHIDVYHHYHYPYWFGYPYWHPTAYWYWYPYWYHWGYYYDYNYTIMVFGLPSYYFVSWYFSIPYHHYLYPYFSDYIIRQYRRGPGPSRSGLAAAVNEWERSNNNEVTRRIITDDSRRVERLKEYGRFETDYQKRQATNRQVPSRETYLNTNKRRYPNLTGTEKNTIRTTERVQERNIRTTTPPSRSYELNRARDVHQRTWERSDYNQRTPTIRTQRGTPSKSRTIRKRDN